MRTSRITRWALTWLTTAAVVTVPAGGRAGTLTGGATEVTQIMNNVQLMLQLSQQIVMVVRLIQQCRMMKRATDSFSSQTEAGAIAQSFISIFGQFSQAAFVGRSLSEQWRATHPGAQEPEAAGYKSVSKAYDAIDRDLHTAAATSLKALDVHVDPKTGASERQIFEALKLKMLSAQGQMQATQVTNELLLEVIRQFHLLRQVTVVQARMQAVGFSDEAQRRLYRSSVVDRDYKYRGKYTESSAPLGGSIGGTSPFPYGLSGIER